MNPLSNAAFPMATPLATKLLKALIVIGLLCLLPALIRLVNAEKSEAATVEQHFFLVDVSGSMLAKPVRSRLRHIELRKEWLKNWFKEHSNSTVTLMSFASEVSESVRCDLANSSDVANGWVDRLSIEKRGGTHLWNALKKAVDRASELTRSAPGQSVLLHVLTDGLDTHRLSTTDEEMKNFPGALTVAKPPGSVALGDFQIRVPATPERGSATDQTKDPSISGPDPSPPISQRPNPDSPSSARTDIVAFDIQEPRIVSSGQLVHFINKTSPRADAYTWTLRRNAPPPEQMKPRGEDEWWTKSWRWLSGIHSSDKETSVAETESVPGVEESERSDEHPVYQFRNGDTQPRSYTVLLTARRGTELITAIPLSVLVQAAQAPSTSRESIVTTITRLGGGLGGTAGIVSIAMLALRAWELKRKDKPAEEIRRNKERLSKVSALTALFLVAFFVTWRPSGRDAEIAAQQSEVEATARAQAISRSSAPVLAPSLSAQEARTAPAINIINTPSDSVASEAAGALGPQRSSLATITLLLVTAIAIAIVFATLRRQKGMVAPIAIGGSPTDQLREIEHLAMTGIIAIKEMEAFKNAIADRLRKQYGIPAAIPPPKSSPAAPSN